MPKQYSIEFLESFVINFPQDIPFTMENLAKISKVDKGTFYNRLGTIKQIAKKYNKKTNRAPTKIELINALNKVPDNIIIETNNVEELTGYSVYQYINKFGGLLNILHDLNKKTRDKITKEDLLKRAKNYKGTITNRNCPETLKVNKSTVISRFGSWKEFLKEIGQTQGSSGIGKTAIAQDGECYTSTAEADFVNKFLYKQYDYKTQVKYSDFLETTRQFTLDFEVETYDKEPIRIEVYSMNSNNQDKKELAESQGVKVYWIHFEDVYKYNSLEDILNNADKELR